jgi:hypothetical protein
MRLLYLFIISFFTFFLDKKRTNLPAGRQENQGKSKCSAAFARAHAQVAELLALLFIMVSDFLLSSSITF